AGGRLGPRPRPRPPFRVAPDAAARAAAGGGPPWNATAGGDGPRDRSRFCHRGARGSGGRASPRGAVQTRNGLRRAPVPPSVAGAPAGPHPLLPPTAGDPERARLGGHTWLDHLASGPRPAAATPAS